TFFEHLGYRISECQKPLGIALRTRCHSFDDRARREASRGDLEASPSVFANPARGACKVWCMMIRTVLADDEVLARQKLLDLLREERDIEIVGECATAAETIQLVTATKPELLFLDIRMPDMDGFDVIGMLASAKYIVMPFVIFTTAYDQYALRAFEIN